jgi:hypothetical protein
MRGVVIHWSVTPARDDHGQCEQDWVNIVAQHRAAGYNPAPAYNWAVCQHGVRFEGRGWGMPSAANGTNESNRDYWALCALQAPGDVPNGALLDALGALIAEAPDLISREVHPHSDFTATACCGDELRAWIAAGAQPPAAPPTPKDDSMQPALFQAPGDPKVYVYDFHAHTKTWLRTPSALRTVQDVWSLGGYDTRIHANDAVARILGDAREIV